MQHLLYVFGYCQNETDTFQLSYVFNGSFICATSIGTLEMDLHALRQRVERLVLK